MDLITIASAALLGLIEGLTEFIPVSSTGHLILTIDLIGFRGPPGAVFEIAIQLGAILAVCFAYRERLIRVVAGLLPREPKSIAFVRNLILAFLPAMFLGLMFHGFIKSVLFSPWVVSVMLIIGGIIILLIERRTIEPTCRDVDDIGPALAVKIGFCQAIAMIPGVSRSGATIMGALMLGVDRKAATEFSFFLAIPTMFAATVYDLFKNRASLDSEGLGLIAIGFTVAFIAALVVVKSVIAFISRHGFVPFAWYRIAIGSLMLVLLMTR